tara:strand:- start:1551 stop:1793 length:243 start_codon:yes stop_codon:yes gene_type:complete
MEKENKLLVKYSKSLYLKNNTMIIRNYDYILSISLDKNGHGQGEIFVDSCVSIATKYALLKNQKVKWETDDLYLYFYKLT